MCVKGPKPYILELSHNQLRILQKLKVTELIAAAKGRIHARIIYDTITSAIRRDPTQLYPVAYRDINFVPHTQDVLRKLLARLEKENPKSNLIQPIELIIQLLEYIEYYVRELLIDTEDIRDRTSELSTKDKAKLTAELKEDLLLFQTGALNGNPKISLLLIKEMDFLKRVLPKLRLSGLCKLLEKWVPIFRESAGKIVIKPQKTGCC